MEPDQLKMLDSVHDWLKEQSELRMAECKANPTQENLRRLKEIRDRYQLEVRNLDRIIAQ